MPQKASILYYNTPSCMSEAMRKGDIKKLKYKIWTSGQGERPGDKCRERTERIYIYIYKFIYIYIYI